MGLIGKPFAVNINFTLIIHPEYLILQRLLDTELYLLATLYFIGKHLQTLSRYSVCNAI